MTKKEIVFQKFLEFEKIHGRYSYKKLHIFFEGVYEEYKIENKDKDINKIAQSFRPVKGGVLEMIIIHILEDSLVQKGLDIINGRQIENAKNTSPVYLLDLKKQILVHYGEFGSHVPDIDLVIYRKKDNKVIAIASVKNSVRERCGQTAYWKLKLLQNKLTENIQVIFITPDNDDELVIRNGRSRKPRAILENDIDGTYILSDSKIEESNKYKHIDCLISDIESCSNNLL